MVIVGSNKLSTTGGFQVDPDSLAMECPTAAELMIADAMQGRNEGWLTKRVTSIEMLNKFGQPDGLMRPMPRK